MQNCNGNKRCYPDKKAALTAMNAIMKGRRRRRPDHLRAYACPTCHQWHLSHKR